jgi:hypothetical protein
MEARLNGQADPNEPLAVIEGRTARWKPLRHFAGYEFVVQCTTAACRPRRIAVASVLAKRPGLHVAEALDKLRCQPCGATAEIARMARANVSSSEHWLLLRGGGLRWRG